MTAIERTGRQHSATPATTCDRESHVTKSLLGYGVIAGPIYVSVSLAQALTRQGFDPTRHAWSLLGNGALGWIQITNFIVTGLMTVAAAAGLRRAATVTGVGIGRWLPRLVGVYGVSLIAAGVFRADPALGFPAGTPADAHAVSWHGALHLLSGSIGFGCLIAACLVAGRAFAARRHQGWAIYSRVTGVVFLAAFAGIASGSQGVWTTLPFTAAVVLAWSWLTCLSARTYGRVS
jgi:hypothetical membrane protein